MVRFDEEKCRWTCKGSFCWNSLHDQTQTKDPTIPAHNLSWRNLAILMSSLLCEDLQMRCQNWSNCTFWNSWSQGWKDKGSEQRIDSNDQWYQAGPNRVMVAIGRLFANGSTKCHGEPEHVVNPCTFAVRIVQLFSFSFGNYSMVVLPPSRTPAAADILTSLYTNGRTAGTVLDPIALKVPKCLGVHLII